MEVSDDEIAQRAYEIWESRGRPEGTGDEDWQTAKDQLIAERNRLSLRRPLVRLFNRLRGKAASL